jgi:hypothetical protein
MDYLDRRKQIHGRTEQFVNKSGLSSITQNFLKGQSLSFDHGFTSLGQETKKEVLGLRAPLRDTYKKKDSISQMVKRILCWVRYLVERVCRNVHASN